MNWYLEPLKKYAVFSGRSSRMEFWCFQLINLAIIIGMSIAASLTLNEGKVSFFITIILNLFVLVMFIPSLALSIRRLHDTGRSGWHYLLVLVPVVGAIVLFVFYIAKGASSNNEYGAPAIYY